MPDLRSAIIAVLVFSQCSSLAFNEKGDLEHNDLIENFTKFLNDEENRRHLKLLRPMSGGEAVQVKVGIHIVYIGKFRESDMEYTMEMYFRQYWKDDRLAFPNLNQPVTFSGELPNVLWQPDTYFENGFDGRLHHLTVLNKFLRLNPDGRVLVSTRLTLTCSCEMDFRKFPMDTQICNLYFASYGFTTRDLIYSWNDEFVSYGNAKENEQFSLKTFRYLNGTRSYATGHFSYLGVRFIFVRRLSFFLAKVYVPAMLVVIVSWLSFFVDKNSVPARISLGITTVLTMTTLIMGLGQDSLPVVSYMRALDWYLIVCYLLVSGSFAEYAVVNYTSRFRSNRRNKFRYPEEISSPERTSSEAFPNLRPAADVENKASISWAQEDLTVTENESSTLDKWSRYIFLPTFIILNVVFWVYYLVLDDNNF
ncbi:gamma-aminobutyric acid receptor subunit rho-2-like isoform X2 [Stylophora pistillata]|uniref:gamma-aminobutyric acid receptor subunit rho-2-like isoform X2 n=1 Tax=Stylophora pistillata TaxID=50429 RepID=UPI000C048D73|nr:gamma-aminobutyric acid receptor subunit rho-2-like isoform X2 [Stylophora pistillata]